MSVVIGMSLERSQVDGAPTNRLGGYMSEPLRHCTQPGWVFPQAWGVLMYGKCSALGRRGLLEVGRVGGQDWRFAGASRWLSTGLSTAVENGENAGSSGSHRGGFLLKMGKSISRMMVSDVCVASSGGFSSARTRSGWQEGRLDRSDPRWSGGRGRGQGVLGALVAS